MTSPVPGTPQPRTPYTHNTPPSTPIRLPTHTTFLQNPRLIQPQFQTQAQSSSSSSSLLTTPQNEYPESPTSPRHRRTSDILRSPRLGQDQKKYRVPRTFRSPRRTLTCFAVLFFIGYVLRGVYLAKGPIRQGTRRFAGLLRAWSGYEDEDGDVCRFESPVEAYERDLARLRKIYPRNMKTYDPKSAVEINSTASPEGRGLKSSRHDHHHHNHNHHYSPTGHLLISDSPLASHPIPLLLSLGEKRWEELLSRQSRTLEEAVREYTRRYDRVPPKGFDLWWEYAMAHDLVLPDEYDRINLDLAPFWALPKEEMKRRLKDVEDMKETFTLAVKDGLVDVRMKDLSGLKWEGTWYRAMDAASLLKAFARYLPDLNATFSIFDQPQIYLSWARRESLVALGLRGEHTTHLKETDDAHVRLSRSCSPDSNFRKNSSFVEGRSLIYDSLEAGDFCQNPYLVPLHGLTIEPHMPESHPRPHTALLPLFSLAKTSINSDILITPLDQFFDPPGKDPKWERKSSSKLAWRGSSTGISEMTSDLPWRQSHRIRLHHFANKPSLKGVKYIVPDLNQFPNDDDEIRAQAELEEAEFHRQGIDNHRKKAQHAFGRGKSDKLGMGVVRDDSGDDDRQTDALRAEQEEAEPEVVQEGPLRFREIEDESKTALDFYLDIKLAGSPIQCSEADGTCQAMRREIKWAPQQRAEQLNQHKFLLDIDGNGWSGRFRRLMSTNSVVIKTGIFSEWFQPHLIPWFMYIPAKMDFSDLYDILAFFRGTPRHPNMGFDETAKALAKNGQCFVQRMYRMEDLHAYMMRLFLEYARIAADEGVDMDFYYDAQADPFGEYEDELSASEEDGVGGGEAIGDGAEEFSGVEVGGEMDIDIDSSGGHAELEPIDLRAGLKKRSDTKGSLEVGGI